MEKIETQSDFNEWNSRVNSFNKAQGICDLQDVYARSDMQAIKDLFLAQTMNEKELTIFCVQKAMGSEKIFSLMKTWARVKAEEVIDENEKDLESKFKELNDASCAFTLEKMRIEKENEGFKAEIVDLKDSVERLANTIQRLREDKNDLELNMDILQNDFAVITAENEKHEVFRDYIKGMIKEAS